MPKTQSPSKASKKKKYNSRFPPARIKKIMQTDEDIGKVAATVPVIISRALELFIESLVMETSKTTVAKQAKTLSASHIKQTIQCNKQFDFLKDVVENISDHTTEESSTSSSIATFSQSHCPEPSHATVNGEVSQKRGRGRPKKNKDSAPVAKNKDSMSVPKRKPGRPRKVTPDTSDQEEEEEDDDEETESEHEADDSTIVLEASHPGSLSQGIPAMKLKYGNNSVNFYFSGSSGMIRETTAQDSSSRVHEIMPPNGAGTIEITTPNVSSGIREISTPNASSRAHDISTPTASSRDHESNPQNVSPGVREVSTPNASSVFLPGFYSPFTFSYQAPNVNSTANLGHPNSGLNQQHTLINSGLAAYHQHLSSVSAALSSAYLPPQPSSVAAASAAFPPPSHMYAPDLMALSHTNPYLNTSLMANMMYPPQAPYPLQSNLLPPPPHPVFPPHITQQHYDNQPINLSMASSPAYQGHNS